MNPRILQVALSLAPGGTERLVIDMAVGLAADHQIAVCCLDEPGAWARELTEAGIGVEALHRPPGFHPFLGVRIAQMAARHRATVLHCHQYTAFVYGRLAALVNPHLRVVFTEHGRLMDAPPSPKRRAVNRIIGRLPATICAVSADLKRHMVAEGFEEARVNVVYNGIVSVAPPTEADRREARAALAIPDHPLVIGTVARLDPVKDLMTLLGALKIVLGEHPRTRLLIIGGGPEEHRLASWVRDRGLEKVVTFTGYRRDARRLLAAVDIYANSSITEGVSLTLLEAMDASLPLVATRVGGTAEVVVDGETGCLVPPKSPEALARALSDLIRQPEHAARLGRAGRARVFARFSFQRMLDYYIEVYHGRPGRRNHFASAGRVTPRGYDPAAPSVNARLH